MADLILGDRPGTEFPILNRWPFQLRLKDEDRKLHKHVIGVAKSGKSKFLESLWLQMFGQGIATSFIDPHGSSAQFLLQTLIDHGYFKRPDAYRRLLYIEIAPDEWFIPWNPLNVPYLSVDQRADIVAEAFKRVWPELVTAAMFDTLIDCGLKILIYNNLTLTSLFDVLTNEKYRLTLLPQVPDPQVKSFFVGMWDQIKATSLQLDRGASAWRRAYLIMKNETRRNILGQQGNVLDFRKLIDQGVSIIFNLQAVEEDTTKIFGVLAMHGFELAARSRLPRTDLPEHQLIVDEFGTFSSKAESMQFMLEQARKAQLYLTLAHQDYSQLSERMRGALSSAQIRVSFQVGAEDALTQAKIFTSFDPKAIKLEAQSERGNPIVMGVQDQHEMWANYLKNLPPRRAVVKIGTQTTDIRTLTLSAPRATTAELEAVKNEYYRLYYTPRHLLAESTQEESALHLYSTGRE